MVVKHHPVSKFNETHTKLGLNVDAGDICLVFERNTSVQTSFSAARPVSISVSIALRTNTLKREYYSR